MTSSRTKLNLQQKTQSVRLIGGHEAHYLYGFVAKTNGLIIDVCLGFVGHRPQSLILYGGSGEIRTRDQRIKSLHMSSWQQA